MPSLEETHVESIFTGRAFEIKLHHLRTEEGRPVVYEIVHHPGAVTLVPVDEAGRVWFVRQYRYGAGEDLLELPAGTLEPGEDPAAAAAREVQEEIGQAAREMRKLGEFFLAPGYSTEFMHVYLATGLYESRLPGDEDEFIEAEAIPLAQAFELAAQGRIRDGKSLAALLLARAELEKLGFSSM